jgi:hypothetical protein
MKNDYLTNMFESPILHISVLNWKEKKSKLLNLCKLQELSLLNNSINISPDFVPTVDTTFYYADTNRNKKNGEELKKEISNILKDEIIAVEEVFQVNFKSIDLAWFQTEKENMFHPVHNHGYGRFSSVCYIDYNPELHTPVHFLCPYHNLFNGEVNWFIPDCVNEGSILFFPSSVNHFTMPNKTQIERKVLSFNMNFEWIIKSK